MNKRPIDKTKKTNIKCEHCEYWKQVCCETGWHTNKYALGCTCPSSPKCNQVTNYWNRCKQFEWRED